MNKEEKYIIPELRFPEFETEQDWKETKLTEVIELLSGYAFKSKLFSKNGNKLLTPKNFTSNGYANFTENNTKYTVEEADLKYICKEGDLMLLLTDLTPSCALLGKPLLLTSKDVEVLLNQRIAKVITTSNIEVKYLLYFFLSESFHRRMKNTASGSTVRHTSNKIILNTTIFLPSIKEQQKTANCLSSLDNLITAETEKLDHLKDHKKGLLQQLFPSKGETKPQFRFSEFINNGDWEEKTIDELGNTISGLRGKKGDDFGSGKPYVTYKQVFGNSYVKFEDCGKVKVSKSENQNALSKGDVLFTTSSETPQEVGFASVIVEEPKETTYLNSFCFVLRPNNTKELLPNFSRFLFHSKIYREKVTLIAQGSTRFNLSKGAFIKLKLRIPHPKEQQKIADCLSSSDDLIKAQTRKTEALKAHKKGLIQQLFPNVNSLSI